MDDKKRLCSFQLLAREIEGETFDSNKVFALATYPANVDDMGGAFCLIASGSYNYANQTAKQVTPHWAKGAYFILDVGGHPASGTLQWFLDVRNPCNGEYSAIAQGTALAGTGTTDTPKKYLVYPDAVDTNSLLTAITQLPMPHEWRSRVITSGGSGTWAYSLGVQYVD